MHQRNLAITQVIYRAKHIDISTLIIERWKENIWAKHLILEIMKPMYLCMHIEQKKERMITKAVFYDIQPTRQTIKCRIKKQTRNNNYWYIIHKNQWTVFPELGWEYLKLNDLNSIVPSFVAERVQCDIPSVGQFLILNSHM